MSLVVKEIVPSLSGEGKYTGCPTSIVRLSGCNLKCSYCDDKPAEVKPRKISIMNVMNAVKQLGNKYVMITGGEPMLQKNEVIPLMYELASENYIAWIETNGSILLEKDHYRRSWSYCMDIKCPSSGMAEKNNYKNLANLLKNDEVKFVIADVGDYMFANSILRKYPTQATVIFSPVVSEDGTHNGRELAEMIISDKLNVRLGMQMHKWLGIY